MFDGLDIYDGLLLLRVWDNDIEEIDFVVIRFECFVDFDLGGNWISRVCNLDKCFFFFCLKFECNEFWFFVLKRVVKLFCFLDVSDNCLLCFDVSVFFGFYIFYVDCNCINKVSGFY